MARFDWENEMHPTTAEFRHTEEVMTNVKRMICCTGVLWSMLANQASAGYGLHRSRDDAVVVERVGRDE